jgi:2-pyrone-4,6-dicarboxylate lactonase
MPKKQQTENADAVRVPELLPGGSCDTQIHVFGNLAKYPPRAGAVYDPPEEATIEEALTLHRRLGFDRAVLVQPSAYGSDHRLLLDVLKTLPASNYCGVAIISDTTTDAEIRTLHESGVRGVRFLLAKYLGLAPEPASVIRCMDRVREYGWITKLYALSSEFLELEHLLRQIKGPAVFDHMASLEFGIGFDQPACRLVVDLLRNSENWWISLSNGDVLSETAQPWTDAAEFGRRLYEAAPDRAIWCTDWPKTMYPKEIPTDVETLELLARYLPNQEAMKRVLVDNPAKLFGFNQTQFGTGVDI